MQKIKASFRFLVSKAKVCTQFVNDRDYLKTLLTFSFFTTVFSILYFSVYTLSTADDHFFHFRFAEEMRDKGLLESFRDFKSLYFSKMAQGNEYFVYYNFLFYLFIIPFTYIKPLFLGIKLYAVIVASGAFTILYWCLRSLNIRYAFLSTFIMFGIIGNGLLLRFFLSRPYILAPALLLLLLYCLHKKKYWGVFLLNLFYLFWHSSTFFFSFGIVVVYYIFEKFYGDKGDYKNIIAGLGGTTVAILYTSFIGSNFMLFMYDTVFGIYKETILGSHVRIPEGNELYPADLFEFIGSNQLLVPVFFVAIIYFIYKYIDSKKSGEFYNEKNRVYLHLTGSSFFLAISFFLGTILVSKRFGDFFVFFGAFFIVLMWNEILGFIDIVDKSKRKMLRISFGIVFFYLFLFNVLALQSSIAAGAREDTFAEVGDWINKNVKEGEVIFYPTWNWFPQMYYHSPNYNYITGLEPRFMYVYNPSLYWKWAHISADGYVCDTEDCTAIDKIAKSMLRKENTKSFWYKKEGDEVAKIIKSDLHSTVIISSKIFDKLNDILDHSDSFEKAFTSKNDFYIYKIVQ